MSFFKKNLYMNIEIQQEIVVPKAIDINPILLKNNILIKIFKITVIIETWKGNFVFPLAK